MKKYRIHYYDMAIQQRPRQITVEAVNLCAACEYVRKNVLIWGGEIVSAKEVIKK